MYHRKSPGLAHELVPGLLHELGRGVTSGWVRKGLPLLLSLGLLFLLAACTPVPPEKVAQPQPADETPTVEGYPTLTPAPAFIAGCTNVRSAGFNMGAAIGTRVCLEGIINKITLPNRDNLTTIEFDTTTSKYGGALYGVTIYIYDSQSFGLDTLNQLVQGERIAVNGLFKQGASYTYVAEFVIELNQASDLIILG
ncbi:MAG: hypothetical protein J0I20_20865 [Chloroflexi bacterium]|nr:hypothetical protein [Chloroflexota bacterium]